jgi:general secretion pathway protein A
MYEAYWQLQRSPFDAALDTSLYYPSEAHQGALLKLRYVVEGGRGGAVLAGGSGTGKTLLVRLLTERLPVAVGPVAHLVFPQLEADELLAWLALELEGHEQGHRPRSADESLRRIERRLRENADAGQHALVVIDEAHVLDDRRTCEALRMLANFERDGRALASLILVGQPGVLALLERMPGFEERLGVKCLLRPLTAEETMAYVEHRLAAVGAERPIFTSEALEALHRRSHGVPRRIHRLADLSLLVGFAEEADEVGPGHVEAVAEELVSVAAD